MKKYIFFLILTSFLMTNSMLFPEELPGDIKYLFPEPSSVMISSQSTIIVKTYEKLMPEDFNLKIKGDKSGIITGQLITKQDGKTHIFKPGKNFLPGDKINVFIRGKINFEWSFEITSRQVKNFNYESWIYNQIYANYDRATPNFIGSGFRQINGVSVPAGFPEYSFTSHEGMSEGKVFFSTVMGDAKNYLYILDEEGTPYYYRKFPQISLGSTDFKLQPTGILTAYMYYNNQYIGMDNRFEIVDSFACGHGYLTDSHELTILPNGNFLVIGQDPQYVDMSVIVPGGNPEAIVLGNIIQELDPEKNVIFEWRSWDHFVITDAQNVNLTNSYIDYVHMNSLSLDYDGNIIASSRHLNEVTKINRETGKIIWRLGGVNNEFEFPEEPWQFGYQHTARPLAGKPDQYLIFDNGNFVHPEFSRSVEYKLNTDIYVAEKKWEYIHTPAIYTPMMGGAQRLPGGNTMIDWSGNPPMIATEVSNDGDIVMTLRAPAIVSYRTQKFNWEGKAAAPYLIIQPHNQFILLIFNKFGDKNIKNYNIYGSPVDEPEQFLAKSSDNYFELFELENNTEWSFRVTAVDSSGRESDFSNQETVFVKIIDPGENTILNWDFSQGDEFWNLNTLGGGTATGRTDTLGQYMIEIGEPGNQLEDIQLVQGNVELVYGQEYKYEFDAYASERRVFQALIRKKDEPYTNYSKTGATILSKEKKHFEYRFLMDSPSDYNALLVFNCGLDSGTIFLDNISLIDVTEPSAVDGEEEIVRSFRMIGNYPNPFNSETRFEFYLPRSQKIKLDIFDILGRRVKTVFEGKMESGRNTINWNAKGLAGGVYFANLSGAGISHTTKVVYLK